MRINPMNYPNDVTYEILSRVPVESALHCKRVCRTWRNFFDDIKEGMIFAIGLNDQEKPCFRLYYAASDVIMNNIKERHTYGDLLADFCHPPIQTRYRYNPLYTHNKDAIVGSCNGLVCFTIPNGVADDPVYICNPFIRESVNLPRLTSPKGLVVSGFGFDLHNKQYKVVRIYYPGENLNVGHVEVYTLGAGSGWRNIGEVTYSLRSVPGILVNGVLYWIDYKAMKIVEFNLKDENFGLLPSPPCLHLGEVVTDYRLKKIRGCLCVVHRRRVYECVNLWLYAEENSTSCSHNLNLELTCDRCWSLEIKMKNIKTIFLGLDDDCDPFLVIQKNKVLYWFDKSNLRYFDPENSTGKFIILDSSYLVWKYFSATPHVNTRVSLRTLEKENCVIHERDGCKQELDKPRPPVDQPPTKVHSDDIIFALKFAIVFWCEYAGWPRWLEQLSQTMEPFISIPMLFIFIFFWMCIFLL